MNKKVGFIGISVLILLILVFLNFCGQKDGWKRVEIEGYGSIKVPQNWNHSVVDGFMYFTSEENGKNKNVLVQYTDDINVNDYFNEVEKWKDLGGEVFSNSALIGSYLIYYQDGLTAKCIALDFTSTLGLTEFICVDNSISEKVLRKIVKSYVMN